MEVRELLISGGSWEDEFLKCFSSDGIVCNSLMDWKWYCSHQWAVYSVLTELAQLMVCGGVWLWIYGWVWGWSVLKGKIWRKWWKDESALSHSAENRVTLECAVCTLQQHRSLRVSLLGTAGTTRIIICVSIWIHCAE